MLQFQKHSKQLHFISSNWVSLVYLLAQHFHLIIYEIQQHKTSPSKGTSTAPEIGNNDNSDMGRATTRRECNRVVGCCIGNIYTKCAMYSCFFSAFFKALTSAFFLLQKVSGFSLPGS